MQYNYVLNVIIHVCNVLIIHNVRIVIIHYQDIINLDHIVNVV